MDILVYLAVSDASIRSNIMTEYPLKATEWSAQLDMRHLQLAVAMYDFAPGAILCHQRCVLACT